MDLKPCLNMSCQGSVRVLVQLSVVQYNRLKDISIHVSGSRTVGNHKYYDKIDYGKNMVKRKTNKS